MDEERERERRRICERVKGWVEQSWNEPEWQMGEASSFLNSLKLKVNYRMQHVEYETQDKENT